jgi:hypothetical protein
VGLFSRTPPVRAVEERKPGRPKGSKNKKAAGSPLEREEARFLRDLRVLDPQRYRELMVKRLGLVDDAPPADPLATTVATLATLKKAGLLEGAQPAGAAADDGWIAMLARLLDTEAGRAVAEQLLAGMLGGRGAAPIGPAPATPAPAWSPPAAAAGTAPGGPAAPPPAAPPAAPPAPAASESPAAARAAPTTGAPGAVLGAAFGDAVAASASPVPMPAPVRRRWRGRPRGCSRARARRRRPAGSWVRRGARTGCRPG